MSRFNFDRSMRFDQGNKLVSLDDLEPGREGPVADAISATYATLGGARADDLFDAMNSPSTMPLDQVPTITQSGTAVIASPVITVPAVVNTGVQKIGWDGRTNPTENNIFFSGGIFSTANGANGDFEVHPDLLFGGGAQAASWPMTFEFNTSGGAQVELEIYAPTPASLRFEVDGLPVAYTTVTGAGTQFILLTFPYAAARTIRVSSPYVRLKAIRVPATMSISKPAIATRRVGIAIADSWGGGAGGVLPGYGASRVSTYLDPLMRAMGATERINMSIGSTGFVSGGATNAYYTRIADALTKSPNFMIFQASQNDSGSSVATIQAAIENVLALTDSVTERYVLTTFWSDAVQPNSNAAARLAVAAHAQAGVRLIDVAGLIAGSGNINGSPVGTRGLFLFNDNAHVTALGHEFMARQAFRQIAPYIYT